MRGGPGRKRGESRRRRGAGLAGPQTVPQEFLALVHGLLEWRAIKLSPVSVTDSANSAGIRWDPVSEPSGNACDSFGYLRLRWRSLPANPVNGLLVAGDRPDLRRYTQIASR